MLNLPQIIHKIATDPQFHVAARDGSLLEGLNLEPSALALLKAALNSPFPQTSLFLPDEGPYEGGWPAFLPEHVLLT